VPHERLAGQFADLRRKVARARRRRETVPCGLCGQLPTPQGHDACLGTLPGVQAACCGQGKTKGYVMFASGQVIRGTFEVRSREARVAILIGDSVRNALDIIDEQPAAVLEVLIERGKRLHLSGNAPGAIADRAGRRRPVSDAIAMTRRPSKTWVRPCIRGQAGGVPAAAPPGRPA
jgi:hypothetical protein